MIQKRTLSKILYNEQQSKDLFSLSITTLCSLSVLITLQSLIKPPDWQASYFSCVWRGFLIVSESLASCSSKLILWSCLTCLFNLTGCMLFSISAVQTWPPISERCLLTSNISLLFHALPYQLFREFCSSLFIEERYMPSWAHMTSSYRLHVLCKYLTVLAVPFNHKMARSIPHLKFCWADFFHLLEPRKLCLSWSSHITLG